jgi:site-specific recombinase XerD
VFGVQKQQLQHTLAHRHHRAMDRQEAEDLFKARVLAYAPTTWQHHASSFKAFRKFCDDREQDLVSCTPPTVNLFLLHLAQNGKSVQSVDNTIASISFFYRFYLLRDITTDVMLSATKRFVSKVCPKNVNLKKPFGSAEVRKIWDKLDAKYTSIDNMPFAELRTFVLAVTQYSSFCRFSDLAVAKLDDVLFDLDSFRINIQYSKTDQSGHGQHAFVVKDCNTTRDAHMLMCIYLQRLDSYDVEDLYLFPPLQ